MASREQVEQLKFSLQALAQTADVQLSLFPDFVCKADELALDFDNWFRIVIGNSIKLSTEQKTLLEKIDGLLDRMSTDASKHEVWTDAALRERDEWEDLRKLASETLKEFKWEAGIPPKDRATYVSSRKNRRMDRSR